MSEKTKQEIPQPKKGTTGSNSFSLLVKSPFGKYKKGDLIADKEAIDSILGTSREHMVLKVNEKVTQNATK